MTNITQICWEKDNIRFLVIRHDESIDENEFSTGFDSEVNYFSAFAVRHFFKLFFFHELVMMKKKKKINHFQRDEISTVPSYLIN